jgi:hypothetical protein
MTSVRRWVTSLHTEVEDKIERATELNWLGQHKYRVVKKINGRIVEVIYPKVRKRK